MTADRVGSADTGARERQRDLVSALKEVGNAYGCYAGCTGALPGAPADGSGHTPTCRAARAALALALALAAGVGVPPDADTEHLVSGLTAALERVVPILENAEQAFREPPVYNDPSLTGWRYEGLASGTAIGLRVVREALALAGVGEARPAPPPCYICGNAIVDGEEFWFREGRAWCSRHRPVWSHQ